jgi:hypothetical protein
MEPERDPLLAALAALPRRAPDDPVDQATRRAALEALEAPEHRAPESLLLRIAISSALALTTLLYLQWAVLAASSLY